MTIRVYAGSGIAFYALIVTLARWLASTDEITVKVTQREEKGEDQAAEQQQAVG